MLVAGRDHLRGAAAASQRRLQVRVDVGGEDRRGDRDADRAADLLARVDQARGEPGVRRRDLGERGDRHRDEPERQAERKDQVGRQQVGPEVAVNRELGVPGHGGGQDQHSHRDHRPRAVPRRQRLGERPDHHRPRRREERDSGFTADQPSTCWT